MPAYLVFSDASLKHMASEKPISKTDFLQISGVGQKKLDLYGEIFIDKIVAFIKKESEQGAKIKGGTYLVTLEYYKEGLTPEEIAKKRDLNLGTVYSHFAQLYEDGEEIDIYKEPVTDEGKNSKRGRLDLVEWTKGEVVTMKFSPNHSNSILETVYENGEILKTITFDEIRENSVSKVYKQYKGWEDHGIGR